MEYQVNINYELSAESEAEAREKARDYINTNLKVKPKNCTISPEEIAKRCRDFRKKKKEHFCVFFLNSQNNILGREIVSIGTLNASIIHPRESFRKAVQKCANSVIFVHNHPSGGLTPSAEDIATTHRLKDAGKILGIEVLDHIIVTKEQYYSLKQAELI